jgi:transaldolase
LRDEWLRLRNELIFKTLPDVFSERLDIFRKNYSDEFIGASVLRKREIIGIIKEITIDMQSSLIDRHLSEVKKVVEHEVALNLELLARLGGEEVVKETKFVIESIMKSNMSKLSKDKDLNNFWGNDNATGLAEAMRKGAVFATTNPPILNAERKRDKRYWNDVKKKLKLNNCGADVKTLTSLMMSEIVLKNCLELRPIFEATGERLGFVCYQVDPNNIGDTKKMIDEAIFVYNYLEKRMGVKPNISFKLPGTLASIEAARVLTGKGIGVTITLCFSTAQHSAFADVIEEGDAPASFVVMMSGRLDDPVELELEQMGVVDLHNIAIRASEAVIKKTYRDIYEGKKYKKSALLVASLRGPWNIKAALTDGSSPVFISSFPDKTDEFDNVERKLISEIKSDIPKEVIDELAKSSIFRHAYGLVPMDPSEFIDFQPVRITQEAFIEAYDEFKKYVMEEDDG